MKQKILLLIVLGSSLLLSAQVQPCDAQNRGAFSFHLENDVFALTDRYYTHGLKLSWISPYKIASRSDPLSSSAISVSFGQNIYTPYDIEREDLLEDDRPYAGISYFTFAMHQKRDQTMDTFEFLLGIVGPSSLAAKMQKFVHSLYRGTQPQGWHHQLKNEIVFSMIFDKKWRIFKFREGKKIEYDLIGLGSGIYNIRHHEDVLNFVDDLPKMKGKKVFIFSTSGLRRFRIFHSFNKHLEKRLLEKGFDIIGEFSCRGFDNNGLLRLIGGIHRGRPNENDLRKAREFARDLKTSIVKA